MSGLGKYYCKNQDSTYEGEYLDGLKHGKGAITSSDKKLVGYWEKGVFRYNSPV